jgi:hypothetical protein
MERVPGACDAKISGGRISRRKAPRFGAPFDVASELEEILSVDLDALDVRRFASRIRRVDDDELRRTVAVDQKITETPAKIEIAVDFQLGRARTDRVPSAFGVRDPDPQSVLSPFDLAVSAFRTEDVPPRLADLGARKIGAVSDRRVVGQLGSDALERG